MPRLFSGISLPESVRDQISDLHQPMAGTRWIDHDDLHLTLRFAGDIGNRTADEFAHFLDDVLHVSAFEMRLTGLGTFGGKHPRLIWAGVEAGPELADLARAHEFAARAAGLPPSRRTFHPHVTIARLRYPRIEVLARYLSRHVGFRSEPFVVSRASLFSAKPHTGGGPYMIDAEFPLAGAFGEDEDYIDPYAA